MSNRSKTLLLLLVDMILLVISLTIVIYLRKQGQPSSFYIYRHYKLFSFIFPFWILNYFIEGLYTLKTYNPANLNISLLRSTVFSVLISVVVIYLSNYEVGRITPKTNLVLVGLMSLPLLYGWRLFFFKFFSRDIRLRGTLLIGSQETIDLVQTEIAHKPHLGYKIVATCTPEQAHDLMITPGIELVAIERKMTKDLDLYNKIFSLLGSGIEVIDLAKFAEKISGKIPIQAIDESWFIEYCGHQESRSYDVIKNLIDRSIAIVLILLFIPVAIVLLPVLLVVHGRPVFFKQVRTGLNNRPFTLYKLRTMVPNAEKDGAKWSTPGDSRITPLGKFLRKVRLDELPQLLNILKGEMSLVGPRPEIPSIIETTLVPSIPYYSLRHLVKPGVTGWAQVTYRYGFSKEDSKEKLQFDLFYVKNRSIWLDLLVIIKTIKTVVTGAGQ